jgi:HlyD family secretion protein
VTRSLSVSCFALAAGVLLALAGCHASSPGEDAGVSAPSATAARVVAAPPLRRTLRRECVQPGQIEAFERTPLFAKLSSYVEKLYVDIGDRVAAEQPMVDLSLPELQDELRQKEAAKDQAQAQIESATAATGAAQAGVATAQANIGVAEAGLISAEANVALWQSNYTRISRLAADGALDRKLEDETRHSLKSAEAGLAEARAKLAAAKTTLLQSQADVVKSKAAQAVTRAQHASAAANLARVKALLQYTQIRAPYAGVVTERNVNRGDFVQPPTTATAQPLFTVARTDTVRIFVAVPEMDSPLVQAGRTGYVSVQAIPDRRFEGKVARTSWALGPNRTLNTEVDLTNPAGLLRPGMYATAHIVLEEHPNAYAIPSSAIVREGKQAFCWAVRNGRAARIAITLGLQDGNDVKVISGLSGDQPIIRTPPGTLQEGQPVQVAAPDSHS